MRRLMSFSRYAKGIVSGALTQNGGHHQSRRCGISHQAWLGRTHGMCWSVLGGWGSNLVGCQASEPFSPVTEAYVWILSWMVLSLVQKDTLGIIPTGSRIDPLTALGLTWDCARLSMFSPSEWTNWGPATQISAPELALGTFRVDA
jgi:hypothetical protein